MTFYVGQKVVCVAHCNTSTISPEEDFPVKGNVYTVRELFNCPASGACNLFLQEIVNPKCHPYGGELVEAGFNSEGFRPAVSPKTDISVFEKILDRTVKGEPVEA